VGTVGDEMSRETDELEHLIRSAPAPRGGGIRPRRVLKAFEQVHDQLREGILTGQIANGARLPTEGQLASDFGVSRSTIREALRLLMADSLIRTVRGAGGGSFVTLPTVDHVAEFLQRNIELLSLTDDVTLEEFLEARELIELFAVRHAATRRTRDDIDALHRTLTPVDSPLSAAAQYHQNRDFHFVLIRACGNSLLRLASEPIFSVLHTHLMRATLSIDFSRGVAHDHREILEAIETGDPDHAAQRMVQHLRDLSVVYRRIWQPGDRPKESD